MSRKLFLLIIFIIIFTTSLSNVAYAQTQIKAQPFGPRVSELQNKEDNLNRLEQIKTIRANLTIINVKATTPIDELKSIDTNLQRYIDQLRNIRANLVKHADVYGNSISDVFFGANCGYN